MVFCINRTIAYGRPEGKGTVDRNWPRREWETERSRDVSKMTPGFQAFKKDGT